MTQSDDNEISFAMKLVFHLWTPNGVIKINQNLHLQKMFSKPLIS